MIQKLRLVEQQRPGMCGPAALRILLSNFDIYKSEGDLARLCHSSKRSGTHPEALIGALEKMGFKTQSGAWGSKTQSWQNLNHWVNKRKLPVLVDWFSVTDGHYSVVIGLDKKHIWLADPAFHKRKDRIRKFLWNDFVRWWFDFEGNHIKMWSDLNVRWWLVAIPQK